MVGRNCRRLRQRAGLTQEDLTERLHVTRQAVSAWETERNKLDAETLTVLAEALGADVRELIYGPGAVDVEEGYPRYQRRYLVSTALCAVVVIAWLVMAATLEPQLARELAQSLDPRPSMTYSLTVPPLGTLGLGCLIPSLASLWVDLRIRSVRVRRVLLGLGILSLCSYLLWATGYLGLWPYALINWEPLRLPLWKWFMTLSTASYKLFRLGPLILSGLLLFLGRNR